MNFQSVRALMLAYLVKRLCDVNNYENQPHHHTSSCIIQAANFCLCVAIFYFVFFPRGS